MTDAASARHPDTIGSYHVLQVIGEGGMGVVYEAEQRLPVRRRVALKMIKLGMDTKEVVARFEAERQALAVMDHPGIAKVFDAGVSDEGRPYFVMELVRGVPLLDYCASHRFDTRRRVELFIRVCEAVQHAHLKGVVHRDLKPSNVLVAGGNGDTTPKVIDFGVAKATGQRLTEQTLVTTYGQALGTLAYMSPEQAEMSGLDIDTRSDIYSLGVTLHELLVGKVPIDPVEVGAPQFLARLMEPDRSMPTLSERLDSLEPGDLERIVRLRGTTLQRLRRELGGDLQWIVQKAMEKERGRRYETANGLAMDLRRFLGNEPTLAHPPSVPYRLGKFVRRHRTGLAATAIVVVALLGAGGVALESRGETLRLEEEARTEAARASAVNDFLLDVFGSVDPREDGRELRVADFLGRASETASERFGDAPAAEGALRLTLGTTYRGLGLYPEAEEEMRATVALYRDLGDLGLPRALHELGRLLVTQGRGDEAVPIQAEGLALRRTLFGERSPWVAIDLNAIAERDIRAGDYAAAEVALREALAIQEDSLAADTEELSNTRSNLAVALYQMGRVDEALPLFQAALESQRGRLGPDHVDVATGAGNLAIVLQNLERFDEAEPLLVEALRINRIAYGDRHDNTARSLNNLGLFYRRVGRLEEAEPLIREAIDINTGLFGEVHREVASNVHNLGLILRDMGRVEEAAVAHGRALEINLATRPDHPAVPQSRTSLAAAYMALGRLEEAEALFRTAKREEASIRGADDARVTYLDSFLGECLRLMGRIGEAEPLLLGALAKLGEEFEPSHIYMLRTYERLADLYDDMGRVADAELYRELLAEHGDEA